MRGLKQNMKHVTEEKIVDYLLGKLQTEEHFYVTRHVKECLDCAEALTLWRELLSAETAEAPSLSSGQSLMKRKEKLNKGYLFGLASLAAILFFLFTGLFDGAKINNYADQQDEEVMIVEKEEFYPKLHVSQTKALEMPENIQVTATQLNRLPTYTQADIHAYYMNQLFFFQQGPLCAYNDYEGGIICYNFDPLTKKYYPLFKMRQGQN